MNDYDGRVALVTGAGSGIGRATAELIAERGGRVVVADIDLAAAQAVADHLVEGGGSATAVQLDAAEPAAHEAAIERTVRTYGRLDWAVNNAGIAGPHSLIADSDPDLVAGVLRVNLFGCYAGLRAQLRYFRAAQHGGSIVNTASITAVNGQAFTAGYNASKHGVAGLTKTAALEGAAQGVRVNAVAPGYVRTPMLDMLGDAEWAGVVGLHPIGRVASADEIAKSIAFLLSDEASFTTGAIVLADGGFSAQ